MKRILKYISVIAMALSCTNLEVCEQVDVDRGDGLTFRGEAFAASKLTIGDLNLATSSFPGLWESGDQIKVYNASTGEYLGNATLSSGAGSNSASFSSSIKAASGTAVRIIYPISADLGGKHNMPTEQTQSAAGKKVISSYTFASADLTISTDGPNSFVLNHIPAYIRVMVSSEAYAGYKINSITFRSEGAKLSGAYEVDYADGSVTPLAESDDHVTLTLSTPLTLSGTTQGEVWLCALPCDLTGKQVSVTLKMKNTSGQDVANTLTFAGKDLRSNTVNTMKVTDVTKDMFIDADKSKPEYATIGIKWNKDFNTSFTTKAAQPAVGMNWMNKVKEGYSDQDIWGGFKGVRPDRIISTNSEGFWRTGRWGNRSVMVDPDGNVALLRGMNNVSPDPMCEASTTTSNKAYEAKFPSDETFAATAANWLAQYGFNMYSSNTRRIKYFRTGDPSGHGISETMMNSLYQPCDYKNSRLSEIEILFFLRTFRYEYYGLTNVSPVTDAPLFALMFDPYYLTYIDGLAKYAASLFKGRKNFVGYYSDNELSFLETNNTSMTTKAVSLKNFLDLKTWTIAGGYPRYCQYAYEWALEWMKTNYGTTTYASSMEDAFVQAVCEYYFRTAAEAIRRNDPDHLYLGCRLHSQSKKSPIVLQSCAKYADAVSINFYDDMFDPASYVKDYANETNLGEKPFIITEFYVKQVNGYGNEGAGNFVSTQTERGIWYNNYLIRSIANGNCAGWEWFKFNDDYNEDQKKWVNKGFVKYDWTGPYADAAVKMLELNRNSNQILKYFTTRTSGTDAMAGNVPAAVWE